MKIRSAARAGGTVLILTVIGSALIGFSLAAYLHLVANSNQAVVRSMTWNAAMPLLEAGIEEALTQLYHTGTNNLGAHGWTLENGRYTKKRYLGKEHYVATITRENPPVVESEGYIRMPITGRVISRKVRVTVASTPGTAMGGMIAREKVIIDGSVTSDSYDSSNPLYSTNGRYDPLKARDNGFIGTNSRLPQTFRIESSATIAGRIASGPAEFNQPVLLMGSTAVAGSFAWVQDPANHGKVQPGWYTDDMNIYFPPVELPFTSGYATPGGSPPNALVLDTGNYAINEVTLRGHGNMLVRGNAVLWVRERFEVGGTSQVIINPNATLTLYIGKRLQVSGKGIINESGVPARLTVYGLPTADQMNYSGSAALVGSIYAPDTVLDLRGSTKFIGASVSREIILGGTFQFHYDESLGGPRASRGVYRITSWTEL